MYKPLNHVFLAGIGQPYSATLKSPPLVVLAQIQDPKKSENLIVNSLTVTTHLTNHLILSYHRYLRFYFGACQWLSIWKGQSLYEFKNG